jgi:hypothetical protein
LNENIFLKSFNFLNKLHDFYWFFHKNLILKSIHLFSLNYNIFWRQGFNFEFLQLLLKRKIFIFKIFKVNARMNVKKRKDMGW